MLTQYYLIGRLLHRVQTFHLQLKLHLIQHGQRRDFTKYHMIQRILLCVVHGTRLQQ